MKMQKNKKLVQAAAVGLSVCVLAGGTGVLRDLFHNSPVIFM